MKRARDAIKDNVKSVSKNDGKIWELSGGVAGCAECGRNMATYTTFNSRQKIYHYYRCTNREHQACPNTKNHGAERLEKTVMDAVANTFQTQTWGAFVDDLCNRRLEDLRRLARSDPAKTRERLAGRIGALQTKITRARDLFIDGDLPRPDYEDKKADLQDEIGLVQEELSKVTDLDDEIKRVEDLRRTLMSVENPLSGNYTFIPGDDYDTELTHDEKNVRLGFGYRAKEATAKRRQEVYRRVGTKVRVGEEGLEICLKVGDPLLVILAPPLETVLGSFP